MQIPLSSNVIFSTKITPSLTARTLRGVFPATTYTAHKAVQKSIHALKYCGIKEIAKDIAFLMAKRLSPFLAKNPHRFLLIPLPLHKRKLRERGFNQNDLLLVEILKHLSFPIDAAYGKRNPLVRRRYTKTQTSLTALERVANLENAFHVEKPALVCNRSIIIIDDVITTGATLYFASRALDDAQAKNVFGFVFAQD